MSEIFILVQQNLFKHTATKNISYIASGYLTF